MCFNKQTGRYTEGHALTGCPFAVECLAEAPLSMIKKAGTDW